MVELDCHNWKNSAACREPEQLRSSGTYHQDAMRTRLVDSIPIIDAAPSVQ
jgi:hypothetical protein